MRCSYCNHEGPARDFYPRRNQKRGRNRDYLCRPCRIADTRAWQARNRLRSNEDFDARCEADGGKLRCRICENVGPYTDHRRNRSRPNGRATECNECHREAERDRRAARRAEGRMT